MKRANAPGNLDYKALWDGHLARPDWAGKMPTPQEIKELDRLDGICGKPILGQFLVTRQVIVYAIDKHHPI
jgi:hypothetical protein